MYRFAISFLASLVFLIASSRADSKSVESKNGIVVCVSPPATDVGVEILRKGGNAVDASVAVAFAMAVTYPPAGNIGGGGFMNIYPAAGKEPVIIEYRETAPSSVNRETFVNETSALTHKAVGVPGTVRGLELAHKKFGKLPWKDLVLPSVKLAEEGFVLTPSMARSLNEILRKNNNPEFIRTFAKNDANSSWKSGNRLIQKDLAKTLRKIAEEGPDAFYTGELADLLVAEMKSGNGFITKDDLKAYRAILRKPIHGTYRGYDIYAPPPPSGGGLCLVEMLNILENFDLKKEDRFSPQTVHLMSEAMRHAYCDRARSIGDPDFTKIPEYLTSKDYAKKIAKRIDLTHATRSDSLAEDIPLSKESKETTHFCVADANGMCVSNTYTLEESYGSRIVVKGAGYLLNNEMGDFNWKPGITTPSGRIGTPANEAAPGKRMLSSQTPTIVMKEGKVILLTGSPGGRTITNTVLNILVNVIDYKMDPTEAIQAPRLHHQWFPDEIRLEGIDKKPELLKGLKLLGHTVYEKKHVQGDAHSIWIDPKSGTYRGVADSRIDGKAGGN